jgi:hypothetical protein
LAVTFGNFPGIHPQYGIRWLEEKCTWPPVFCFARGEMDLFTVTKITIYCVRRSLWWDIEQMGWRLWRKKPQHAPPTIYQSMLRNLH